MTRPDYLSLPELVLAAIFASADRQYAERPGNRDCVLPPELRLLFTPRAGQQAAA